MPIQSREFLLQQLEQAIHSGGAGGLTTAQDVRAFATTLIDQLISLGAEAPAPAVVQTTGQSEREVMSQKAVTDALGAMQLLLLPVPAAPLYVGQDDAYNTFEFGLSAGYPLAQHRYRINGGPELVPASTVLAVGNVSVAAAAIEVYVAASAINQQGTPLRNQTPFLPFAEDLPNILLDTDFTGNPPYYQGGWFNQGGWTLNGDGTLTGGNAYLYQDIPMEAGANYRIRVTISDYSAGSIRLVFNSAWPDAYFSGNGTHEFVATARSAQDRLHIGGNGFSGVLSALGCYRV